MKMAFYNFSLLAAVIFLMIISIVVFKRNFTNKKWFKKLMKTTVMIAIIIMTFSVLLFPDFKSVKTTGEYPYASCVMELTDPARIEAYKNDGSSRKLSILVYYPDTDIQKNTCPLIVFSHGGISTKASNLSLYQELASHGYVVVSADHTYHALSTQIEGKTIPIDPGYFKEINTENSHEDINNSYACFQKWMKLRTDDISFVIDTCIQNSMQEDKSFYSLIDADHIGVAGHSLGGSAALGAARQRNDIKAVIALESPYMCDITGVDGNDFMWNTNSYPCAMMNIYSDSGYPLIEADHKYVQNKNYLYHSENVEYYYIKGSNHYSLTDLVRKSPALCALLGGGYEKSGYDTLAFINQKCLAFFDKHL